MNNKALIIDIDKKILSKADIKSKSVVEIVVTGNIYEVDKKCFKGLKNLKKVTLPEGIDHIHDNAFKDCCELEEIILPNSLQVIGASAFENCVKLKKIDFPDSVGFMGMLAFKNCSSLKKIKLSPNMNYLLPAVFSNCTALEEVDLNSVLSLSSQTFKDCTSLKKVRFGNKIERMEKNSFENCDNLEETDLSINQLRYFEDSFSKCEKLNLFGEKVPDYYIVDNVLLKTFKKAKRYVIPDNVIKIKSEAFYDNSFVESIVMSDNVTEIERMAFKSCINLKEIVLSNKLTKLNYRLFMDTPKLTNVIIPSSVTEICESCFGNSAIKNCLIPINVNTISSEAFNDAYNLEEVYLPNNLKLLERFSFSRCTKLDTIISYDNYDELEQLKVENKGVIMIPKNIKRINQGTFINCKNIKKIILPNDFLSLGERSLEGCVSLECIANLKNDCKVYDEVKFKNTKLCDKNGCYISDNALFEFSSHQTNLKVSGDVNTIKSFAILNKHIDVVDLNNVKKIENYGINECNINSLVINDDVVLESNKSLFNSKIGELKISCEKYEFLNSDQRYAVFNYFKNHTRDEISAEWVEKIKSLKLIYLKRCVKNKDFSGIKLLLKVCDNFTISQLNDLLASVNETEIQAEILEYKNSKFTSKEVKDYRIKKMNEEFSIEDKPLTLERFKKDFTFKVVGDELILNKYRGLDKNVVIPKEVNGKTIVALREKIFFNNLLIESVVLPSSIREVGASAFMKCKNLVKVELSDEITEIKDFVFKNCEKLYEVKLPKKLLTIGKSSFYNCRSLKIIEFPDSIVGISRSAFVLTKCDKPKGKFTN